MPDISPDPSDGRTGWLAFTLLVDYADQFWIEDEVIEEFEGAWRAWVKPVIEQGKAHSNLEKNWICFALAFNYLSNEGYCLPICSKPWIATIRAFLAILGTECPRNLRAKRPPKWSNLMPGSDFPHPSVKLSDEEIAQVRSHLQTIVSKSEGLSVERLVELIADENWKEVPEDRSVIFRLREAVVTHHPPADNPSASDPIQSLLIRARPSLQTKEGETPTDQYRAARKRSIEVQLEEFIRAISGKPGSQGLRCSIEELAGFFSLPRKTSPCEALDSFRDNSTFTMFLYRSRFPGKLANTEWLPKVDRLFEPPDPRKLWIAFNWVNPNAPFWMMKAPAIYRLKKYTRLLSYRLDQKESRREDEQKKILDDIASLKLPKFKPTQPITDFMPNLHLFTGFQAEGLHTLIQKTHLGSAQLLRAGFDNLKLEWDSPSFGDRFHST